MKPRVGKRRDFVVGGGERAIGEGNKKITDQQQARKNHDCVLLSKCLGGKEDDFGKMGMRAGSQRQGGREGDDASFPALHLNMEQLY